MRRRTYEWVTEVHAAMARKALEEAGWEVVRSPVGPQVRRGGDAYIATSDAGLVSIAENVGAITFGDDGEMMSGDAREGRDA